MPFYNNNNNNNNNFFSELINQTSLVTMRRRDGFFPRVAETARMSRARMERKLASKHWGRTQNILLVNGYCDGP